MESDSIDIKKFVNGIFAKKGLPPVKNFPSEFSDGSNYLFKMTDQLFLGKF
jgi:hypothetical protein